MEQDEKDEIEEKEEREPIIPANLLRILLHASLSTFQMAPVQPPNDEIPSWLFEIGSESEPNSEVLYNRTQENMPIENVEEEVEEEEEEEEEDPCSVFQTEGPPPKKSKPNIPEIDYNFIELSTKEELYFNEDDGKDILLPESAEPNIFVRKILSQLTGSIKDRLMYLAKIMKEKSSYDHNRLLYHDLKTQVVSAYLRESRLRLRFRHLVQRWRIRRMDQRFTSDIDPITLSEPEKKVVVYDWGMKKKFVFEAKSISQIVESALLYYEGGFAMPKYPRNPWTNTDFSYLQLFSIYQQLHHHKELGWCLQTLREYNFNKTKWNTYHHSTITMVAIKTSLRLLDSLDARELLEDFIFCKIDDLGIHSSNHIQRAYHLAILQCPDHWYLQHFKQLAFMHYEAQHFRQNRQQSINQKCLTLFKKQHLFLKDLVQRKIIQHV
jgi:hypothetical protein